MTIYCQICEQDMDFKNIQAFGTHINKKHFITVRRYYDQYKKLDQSEGLCRDCHVVETRFRGVMHGYVSLCRSCASRRNAKLQWSGDHGVERKELHRARLLSSPMVGGRPKGTKNKNEYPMSAAVHNRIKVSPPPSFIGKTHTLETKSKMSDSALKTFQNGRKPVMSYKGKFKPKNYKKYKGDPTRIVWRSLWEKHVMEYLDGNPNVLSWSSEEISISYVSPKDRRRHSYFPDFLVESKEKDGMIKTKILEVKPYAQCIPPKLPANGKATRNYVKAVFTYGINQSKWEAARLYCANRKWEFVIITERELGLRQ